ncbi:arginine exporter protein ArgO [Georgenia soli]|uniref:Arginine exporter protein ArgO n=1 Tax=Georgenia soli TaxID=638953 RepID=A0A2A9ESI3_9MICO|nr:LysE family transporter [Georgenia soli]PFG41222.1 arginine exporter protein ArgO [Georgenia soli]
MTDALLAGVVAGYGIAVPVGAIAAYLVTLGAREGWRTAAAGGLGAAAVDGLYAAVAVAAGTVLAPVLGAAQEPLRWAAATVLLVLGIFLLRPALRPSSTTTAEPTVPTGPAGTADASEAGTADGRAGRRPARAFLTVFGLTLVNPATVVYFTALVAGRGVGVLETPAQRAAFVVGAFAASASWQLLLAGAGARLGRALTGPRGRRWTALVGGSVVVLLAVRSALGG